MDFERIQTLFEQALAQPPEQRARFLDEACPDDSAIRTQVSEMLANHHDAFSWFDGLERDLHAAAAQETRSPEGVRIGPYRLLRQIGRGGMGAVYLAERADGQFEQQVAIKLTRFEHESAHTLRRFLAERQILSRLEHAGIARLFDGGATEQGRPYFVMEYVDGTPLNTWCGERKLSIHDRLRLFLRVCDAVEYAHRNLVVHRDLKPANILVTAAGSVKLLDFGIAKLLASEDDAPAETQTGVRPFTPDYAAPEQLLGEPITTVTDVYGLGAVLYELLSGRRPLKISSRSWTELERVIVHQEPIAPSAAATGADSRALAGDLDTICLKCLQKDPERRYPSVSSLTDDIRRYLGGLPVLARKDTLAYRTSKFLRRHRWAVGAVAAVFLLVSGFAVALAVQSARVARERDKVQQVSE
ncbi:MAG: serine/threonine protein kinase, partial [Bryobacteraceae bacterium]